VTTSYLKTTVELTSTSGFAKDNVVNDFYFITDDTPLSALCTAKIQSLITDFYNTAVSGADTVCNGIGSSISRIVVSKISTTDVSANLAGLPGGTGSPFNVDTFTLGAVGFASVQYPREVAIALSFHGDYGTLGEFGLAGTRPRARHRGRIYLGPFNNFWTSFSSTSNPQLSTTGATTIAGAAERLLTDSNHLATWAVWSRKNAAMYPVVGGWVDNAFDTQRRRGEDANVRTVFP